jgi:hypothetical protein
VITPPRAGSLRARLFAVLRESPLPVTTVDLAMLALDRCNAVLRVRQVLVRAWARGEVLRLDPLRPALPRESYRGAGRWAFRWALTPLGLAVALARPRPARKRARLTGTPPPGGPS